MENKVVIDFDRKTIRGFCKKKDFTKQMKELKGVVSEETIFKDKARIS